MGEELREGFDELLPMSPRRTAPGEYDILGADGRVLWRMEGAALAGWVCDRLNDSGRRGLRCGKCGGVMAPVTRGPHVVGVRCRVCA